MSAMLAATESPAPKPVFAATESAIAKFMFKMFPMTATPIEASVVGAGITVGISVPVAIRIGVWAVVGTVNAIRISIRSGIDWQPDLYTKSHGRVRRTGAHDSQNCCQREQRDAY